MDIEQSFAAEVFNAEHEAKLATAHGYPTTAAEQIEGALADLWQYEPAGAQAIAARYVEWVDGVPRARAFERGKVVALRHG